MLADRASAFAQWDLPLADALRQEGAGGFAVVAAEGVDGAARFADGAGRRGQPAWRLAAERFLSHVGTHSV